MKRLNNEKEELIIQNLKKESKDIYSISKLNTANNCWYEYYKTYILKEKGVTNPYSEIGSISHDQIEEAYINNKVDNKKFNQKLHDKLLELDIMDLKFPNDKIKDSYIKDMDHFSKNFKMISGDFTLEKMFITQIDGNILMGYIDAIRENEGKLEVIDWKTSSKFIGKDKLKSAGRQLLIYKIGLEQSSDIKIDKIQWCMLKYVYVCTHNIKGSLKRKVTSKLVRLKNKLVIKSMGKIKKKDTVIKVSKIKRKMINRGKIISDMKSTFENSLNKYKNNNELENMLALELAENNNDFNQLPKYIKNRYWLEDCFLEYKFDEKLINEVKEYVINTIKEIKSKDVNNKEEWEPIDFEKEGNFYCNTLCNHRFNCEYIKEYNKNNTFKKSY